MAGMRARQIHKGIKKHSFPCGNLSIAGLPENTIANCRRSCQAIHMSAV